MGLFSGKKITYRDFTYARLIEDEYLPDIMGQAITKYVLDEDNTTPLADLMLEYGWKSNNVKWNAAYRWASKTDKYYYGTASSTVIAQTDFTDAETLNSLLASLSGRSDLTYAYSQFGPTNLRHCMWQLLIDNYNYSATTNILGTLSTALGTNVYMSNARNMLTSETKAEATTDVLVHWGYPPRGGFTQNRSMDYTRPDTQDGTSYEGYNYVNIEYTGRLAAVERSVVRTTNTIVTTVRTPDGSGGYNDVTTTTYTTSDSTTTNWKGQSLPATGIVDSTEMVNGTTSNTITDPTTTTTNTNPTTGVITIVETTPVREIEVTNLDIDFTAETTMGFGQYDFVPDGVIDTDTVLDDNDKGVIDPNAPLDPSGESEGGDEDYFQVCFTYPVSTGVAINYFTYQYGSGSYPDLDGITSSTVADFGKGFPRMYFRLNGIRMDDGSQLGTKAYTDSKRMGNKLDLPWLEVSEQIYGSLSAVNKIRDVCLIQCVPANTENELEQEYLFNYFRILYNLRSPITFAPSQPTDEFTTWAAHEGCVIQSKDGATTIGNSVKGLGYRQLSGAFGAVGATASGRGTGTRQVRSAYTSADGELIETYTSTPIEYHYYRIQTTATYYDEIRVYNLEGTAQVGGRTVTKGGSDENLVIPLDYAFRKMFSAHERETLYARATRVLICTEYSVKTKWYQTGLFQAVVIVVAVVLSWWTGGASMTLVGAVTAAASAIGAMVVMSLLSKYVFSKLGGAFAIIATVVAVAVAIYTGYIAISGTSGPFSITAMQMMQVSNVAFQAAQSAQQGAIEKEMQKIARLEEEIADKQASLDAAQKELNNPYNTIEDGVLLKAIQGYTYLGEKPGEYYSRTLNTNIGVETNNLVNMYYSQSLENPSDVAINQLILQNIQRPFELFNELTNQINQ